MRIGFYSTLLAPALLIATPAAAEDVPLEKMLVEIKRALTLVSQNPDGSKLPPLKSATLNASTVQKVQAGGKFKLFIIEIGHTKTRELTTSVSITMVPSKTASQPVAANLDLAKRLAAAILSAGQSVASSSQVPPNLQTKEIKATIKFGVTGDTNGGITFTLAPAEIGVSGEVSNEATQEIEIVYGS